MRATLTLLVVLIAGCGSADPCDALCDDAGFSGVDVTAEGCFCSAGSGLGGELNLSNCEDYCTETTGSDAFAHLESSLTSNDSCVCVE
ncbi:MAG: hypothetical protein KC912_22810 [Proteobacteria bacterium]|nr:hypothetical protein [Pseudomonadota bacterium]